MVKLQYLPLCGCSWSASLLLIAVCQIAPLPVLLVPAPKERLFSLRYVGDASYTSLCPFLMSANRSDVYVFQCEVKQRDAMALLPYAFLKLAIENPLRIIAFCLLVRLAMMFIFSSSVGSNKLFSDTYCFKNAPCGGMITRKNKSSCPRLPKLALGHINFQNLFLVSSTVFFKEQFPLLRLSCFSNFSIGESVSSCFVSIEA